MAYLGNGGGQIEPGVHGRMVPHGLLVCCVVRNWKRKKAIDQTVGFDGSSFSLGNLVNGLDPSGILQNEEVLGVLPSAFRAKTLKQRTPLRVNFIFKGWTV